MAIKIQENLTNFRTIKVCIQTIAKQISNLSLNFCHTAISILHPNKSMIIIANGTCDKIKKEERKT